MEKGANRRMLGKDLLLGLTFYRQIADHEVLRAWQGLMEEVDGTDQGKIIDAYHRFNALALEYKWPNLLLDLILDDDNLFSRAAANKGTRLSSSLKEIARRDLTLLQEVINITPQKIKEKVISNLQKQEEAWEIPNHHPLHPHNWPVWDQDIGEVSSSPIEGRDSSGAKWLFSARKKIKKALVEKSLADGVDVLAAHYKEAGIGIFGHYAAVRWHKDNSQGRFKGIQNPDPIQLDDLVGLERVKKIVLENTEHFLAGLPSNNVLLYGSRGTGKSSMVKALLNAYVKKGLRLVELAKNDLQDFAQICQHLEKEPFKFIIFIDDLSFDDNEPEYKVLKTLIEGGIQVRPENILVYATSNRKHLIKETHEERQAEVHGRDVHDEKLSLSDRFGITVTFTTPDQNEYLEIVESLAAQNGLSIEKEELHQLALRWVLMQNGRSGRTAKQLVDKLVAQAKFDAEEFF